MDLEIACRVLSSLGASKLSVIPYFTAALIIEVFARTGVRSFVVISAFAAWNSVKEFRVR